MIISINILLITTISIITKKHTTITEQFSPTSPPAWRRASFMWGVDYNFTNCSFAYKKNKQKQETLNFNKNLEFHPLWRNIDKNENKRQCLCLKV